jgi:hypothetical protein
VDTSGARSWLRIASIVYVCRKDSMTVYWRRPAAGLRQQRSLYKHTKNMYICTTDRYPANVSNWFKVLQQGNSCVTARSGQSIEPRSQKFFVAPLTLNSLWNRIWLTYWRSGDRIRRRLLWIQSSWCYLFPQNKYQKHTYSLLRNIVLLLFG